MGPGSSLVLASLIFYWIRTSKSHPVEKDPMQTFTLRRIRLADADATQQLAALRHQLGAQGNVVSARGRQLTEKVFGEALAPVQVVERICTDVRTQGLSAVLHYTQQFDGVRLNRETIRVGPSVWPMPGPARIGISCKPSGGSGKM